MKQRIISLLLTVVMILTATIAPIGNNKLVANAETGTKGTEVLEELPPEYRVVVTDTDTYTTADGQFSLQYVPSDNEIEGYTDEEESAQASGNARTVTDTFLTDCSSNFSFLELNSRSNSADLQTIYLKIVEQIDKYYEYGYDATVEDMGVGELVNVLGMVSYSGLNVSNEELLEVFVRVLYDHPLFFFVSNQILYTGTHLVIQLDDEFVSGTVRKQAIEDVRALMKDIASSASAAKGNYQTCKLVHDRILEEAAYAFEADGVTPENSVYAHNIIGIVKDGRIVCDGYAKTFSAVLNYLDIPVIYTAGWGVPQGTETPASAAHAWNVVQLDDGKYYFVDATWDDTAGDPYLFFAKGLSFYETHSLQKNTTEEGYLLISQMPEISENDYTAGTNKFYKIDDPTYEYENTFKYSYNSTTNTLTFSGNGIISGYENYRKNAWYKYAAKAEKLVIKDGITGVGDYAFNSFTKLKSIDFPNQMSRLGQEAFANCTALTKVVLPDGISFYDSGFFSGCKALKTVTFGASEGGVISVHNYFDGCSKLTKITVPENNFVFTEKEGVLFIGNPEAGDSMLICYIPTSERTSYTVPEGTAVMGRFAFSGCNNLKKVTIPSTVIRFDIVFKNSDALTSVTIPKSVQVFTAGQVALFCEGLKTIVNKSSAAVTLPIGEASMDGTTFTYWKNKSTGKYVSSISNGTAVAAKHAAVKKYIGERFKVNGVTYEVTKDLLEPMKITLTQLNAQKPVGYVKTVAYAPGFKLPDKVQYKGWYYKVTKVTVLKPSEPSTVKASLYGYDDVKVSWSQAKNTYGYKVYYKKSSDTKYTYVGKTTEHSMKIANLTDGKKYTFKVVPYITLSGKTYTKSPTKTVSLYTLKKIGQPTVKKVSSSKVKVSWKNIEGETGYQISKSTSKTGTKIVSTYKTTSGSSKQLSATKKTKYYYKVRAYRTVGSTKIYGPWSDVKAYTLK